MATHFKSPAKPRAPKTAPISLKEELEAEEPVEAPADTPFAAPAAASDEPEPLEVAPAAEIIEPAPLPEPVAILAEPVVVAEPVVAPPIVAAAAVTASVAPAAPTTLDAAALPLKTIDLFNENAAAVLDFALALGKVTSVGDAFELQSRFASERYSSLVRQAGEFAELTRRLAFQASPVKLSVSTFLA